MLVERWLSSSLDDRESALISRRYGVPGSFILFLYWNWCSYRLEMGESWNLWIVVKDVMPLVLYDVECEMAMVSMKGKCTSSWVDLGYTNLFCIPDVTSVFFSCCDSVLGDSLQFHQGNPGSLRLCLETRNSSAWNVGESGLIFQRGRSLMSFLELRQEPGIHSRVTAGMSIRNWSLFSEGRTPVFLWGTTQECKLGVAGQYRSFWKLSVSSGLFFWQCSWGFSSVPSGKSRYLTSLIVNMELLSMKCRGIGPHLAVRGKSHEFSRVGAGTWFVFSSYGWDGHLKLGLVQRSQDSCLVMTDTSGS